MQEFKGTAGKWSFSHGSASDDNVACIEINSSESLHEIAYLQSTPESIGKYEQTSFDKTIANAHLIAAAPELLEALRQLRDYLEDLHSAQYGHHWKEESHPMFLAGVAINKALGKD